MVCGLQKDYNLFLTFRTLKSKEIPSMPHVVCEACIGCKRTDCVDVCPVDCFREGPNFLVIDPDECRLRRVHPRMPGSSHLRRRGRP